MRWSDEIDAMNPEEVPRIVDYRDQKFMPLEPCTEAQQTYLLSLSRQTKVHLPDLYGAGYDTVEALSAWAASWGIEMLLDARSLQEDDEKAMKSLMAAIMKERVQMFPIRRCRGCDEDRPHRLLMGSLYCEMCGRQA